MHDLQTRHGRAPAAGAALLAVLLVIAAPVGAGDPEAGEEAYLLAHDTDLPCTACHDSSWFLDPSNRTASSFFELRGWVQGCNQEFPQGWFPEDEDNVAAWLNAEYYGFDMD